MRITITEELKTYLSGRKKRNIVVDVATSDTSDFDVSEIFLRLCDHKHKEYLIKKHGFREKSIEGVDVSDMVVLFKPYRMEMEEEIEFGVKKTWIFNHLTYKGLKL